MTNPDPAWSLGSDDDFVLEDDDTFGLGEIESGDLPPFDHAETPDPANETTPPPHVEGEDESVRHDRACNDRARHGRNADHAA